MLSPYDEIQAALEILGLPALIQKEDIKKQYYFLAKKYHPDQGGNEIRMEKLNHAYKLLMKYIEHFRYSFDKEEIFKQFPGVDYANRFRP